MVNMGNEVCLTTDYIPFEKVAWTVHLAFPVKSGDRVV